MGVVLNAFGELSTDSGHVVLLLLMLLSQVSRFETTCLADYECDVGLYCCTQRYAWQTNVCKPRCLREPCFNDEDCAIGECCDSHETCINETSSRDNGCSTERKNRRVIHSCVTEHGPLATWMVAAIALDIIAVIITTIAMVVWCLYCTAMAISKRRSQERSYPVMKLLAT